VDTVDTVDTVDIAKSSCNTEVRRDGTECLVDFQICWGCVYREFVSWNIFINTVFVITRYTNLHLGSTASQGAPRASWTCRVWLGETGSLNFLGLALPKPSRRPAFEARY
jgi:hypothetical protein